jgi:hypothetical protein
MTQEEVENNYTYKIVRKVLMREYPWIKDVQLDVPRLENFTYVIFLDIFIDPYELGKEQEWDVARWIDRSVEQGEQYESMSLSLFFVGSTEDMRELKNDVNTTIEDVQQSPAIPPEMRMPEARFMVGSFFTVKDLTVPEPEPDEDIEEDTY